MDEKQKYILEQVSSMYLKYGIKSVTMDDVARELSISKKTLYEYFKDKNELVKQFLEFHMLQIKTVFDKESLTKGNAIDHLLYISKIMSDFLSKLNTSVHYDLQKYHPEVFKSLFEYKRKHMYQNVMANIKRGIKEGLYRKDLTPEIIAYIYVNRIEASLDANFILEKEFSTSKFFKEMFTYHIRGICSRKGIEYFEKQICLNKYISN
jgi:AcrR family transcriptional regulator